MLYFVLAISQVLDPTLMLSRWLFSSLTSPSLLYFVCENLPQHHYLKILSINGVDCFNALPSSNPLGLMKKYFWFCRFLSQLKAHLRKDSPLDILCPLFLLVSLYFPVLIFSIDSWFSSLLR